MPDRPYTDADLRERVADVQKIAKRLVAHAKGFQDVLDESDRDPWARLVRADIDELRDVTADEIAERPLSPYYEHPTCGFHWHGRDGMDIPIRDGQPVCPRCELAKTERKLAALQRRRDAVGAECKRRGKRVLSQSERIHTLEREIDEVRSQLGAEILRAGQAEAELRRMADEAQQTEPAPDTLAAWLYQRFTPAGDSWDNLGEDNRTYWEHQARAVRRAVDRGGFKPPVDEAQQDGQP